MKYLFDTLTKNTLTLAKLYKYTKEGDEFRLYDPEAVQIEGFDVQLLSNIECKMIDYSDPFNMKCEVKILNYDENDVKVINRIPTYTKEIDDSRKMLSTLDFDKALEWCDVYVTLVNPEGELNTATNVELKTKELQELFDRINKALEKEKKIYLGTNANSEFKKIINDYEGCINERITKENLDDILKYKGTYFLDKSLYREKITFLIGTSSMSGKMSNLFKAQKMYEDDNEKVALICTEEIYYFFDTKKYNIYSFCRNYSELTLDEEIMYLRCLIEKIINKCKPQRIVIASQGTFSYPQVITNYNYEDVKPHGMLANLLLSCIGCDSVIISTSWKNLELTKRLIDFFNASYIPIDCINISPLHLIQPTLQSYGNYAFKMNSVLEDQTFQSYVLGFLIEYPYLKIKCDYMGTQEAIDKYIQSDEFFEMYKSYWITKLASTIQMTNKNLYQTLNDSRFLSLIDDGLQEKQIELTDDEKKILEKTKEILKL